MRKKLALLLVAIAMVGGVASSYAAATNDKPFVVPELRQWTAGDGQFTVSNKTKIIVHPSAKAALSNVAEAFAKDVQTMFGMKLKVTEGEPSADAIFFNISKIPTDNAEGYSITTTHKGVSIGANTAKGAFWATRTMLQMLEQDPARTLTAGVAVDYPAYPVRGFMLDVGRKYFTIDFLRQYVKFMAYYKMNTFQIHLNDQTFPQFYSNEWDQVPAAFRLESETFPGLASPEGHYTKEEFKNLQILAENNFVNIIPEIDAPAHTLAFTHYKPEIGSKEYGMDHLDLFNPETYKFMDALIKEYLGGDDPVFRGEYFHIGTDEYSNKDPKVADKFRYFTDRYIKYTESFGKKAMLWGALTHARGTTPVKVKDVLMACWYNGYAEPDSMMRLGYDVVSVPDGDLYIVPMAGYYRDYLDTKTLYNKWTPANIGNKKYKEDNPQIKGGMFAVWNDHTGNGISSRDVHHRVWPAMQTLAVKMWDGSHATLPYDQFNAQREKLSEAPGINMLGRAPKGVMLDIKTLKANSTTAFNEVGYDYRVSMDVMANGDLTRATILSHNEDATVYLADPLLGKIGFSRDGYLFNFNYKLPVGKMVQIAIQGDSRSTSLWVDGRLVEKLDVTYTKFQSGGHNSKRALVKTLQFPLASFGALNNVTITNFKVEKL
ncbi:MAG: family 20 glycosylhydrolase [Mucinivorans sp.]